MMAVTMMTLCMAGFGTKLEVSAAETPYTETLSIDGYKEVAPKPADAAHKDWLFAGWYTDEACTDYVTETEMAEATGNHYAKFVPADVLTIRCQNLEGTTAQSDDTKVRIVTTVDSVYYQKAGFEVSVNGKSIDKVCTAVYSSIKASEGGVAFTYAPTDFCAESNYFATVTIDKIEIGGYGTAISIKPYWVTMDGTKVYGVSRMARVEDGYLNIINVPVRVYTDKMVAAGKFVVNYDSTKYEYVGADTGSVLSEVYAADNAGKVTCVGNTYLADNTKADGLLVNLRFRITGTPEYLETFEVNGEQFADVNENWVYTGDNVFDISNVTYKTIVNK